MFFQIANVEVAFFVPILVGFGVSFFCSMGGVSGAFILIPFQISFLGCNINSVSATNHLFNIIGIPGGLYRYYREKKIIWPLALLVIFGSMPGIVVGVLVRVYLLSDPSKFKFFVALVLFYISFQMIIHSYKKKFSFLNKNQSFDLVDFCLKLKEVSYILNGKNYKICSWKIFSVSLIIGIVGGIYGIGGGAILAPIFVFYFKFPVHSIAGTALISTFCTSFVGVILYQIISLSSRNTFFAPDWYLGVLFGIGGIVGMYAGALCQKFISSYIINWMLVFIMLITSFKYCGFF